MALIGNPTVDACTKPVSVLFAVTSSKEEEARWAEEETLQNSQQPFGRSAGGLYRWRACKEVKSSASHPQN